MPPAAVPETVIASAGVSQALDYRDYGGLGQAEYFGQAPYLAPDCARALLDAGTALLGVDVPSVDLGGGST